jgi:hypothetical protein
MTINTQVQRHEEDHNHLLPMRSMWLQLQKVLPMLWNVNEHVSTETHNDECGQMLDIASGKEIGYAPVQRRQAI